VLEPTFEEYMIEETLKLRFELGRASNLENIQDFYDTRRAEWPSIDKKSGVEWVGCQL
jgi:hypothetical protein